MIAGPMLVSNISQPLLSLVDTAVVGHMGNADYLAAVAIGAMLITQLYWLLGALRMGTTALSAQARGQQDQASVYRVLVQAVWLAVLLSVVLFICTPWLLSIALQLTHPSLAVGQLVKDYFYTRAVGIPAALVNLALIGWFLGQQRARLVMTIQVVGNLLNAGLNLLFVYGFHFGVSGVAAATVVSEYSMLIMALSQLNDSNWRDYFQRSWLSLAACRIMLKMKSAILLRNIALQACLAFMVIQGARYGAQIVALNSLLHQFFILCALGLDAVAYAAEALVGESRGGHHADQLWQRAWQTIAWSAMGAMLYSVLFVCGSEQIVAMLTDIPALRLLARDYYGFIWLLPLVAHWCFVLDGIYIGLGRADVMRNSMMLSAAVGFFAVFYLFRAQQNQALWLALLSFLALRGISLLGHFSYLRRSQTLTG